MFSPVKKSKTIFKKTFYPILFVFVSLIAIYTIFLRTNVLGYLQDNAVERFDSVVANRKVQIEYAMNNYLVNVDTYVETIVSDIEKSLELNGASTDQIKTDAELSQKILQSATDDVLRTLRATGATEAFVVLDGQVAGTDSVNEKPGVYLRTISPVSYSDTNIDILFERGSPSISKEWKFSLDSFWSANFTIGEESEFYTKPLNAARESENKEFHNFAYWSYSKIINKSDKGILSWSVPLITSNGEVIGVMGIGVNKEYFLKGLDYREISNNNTGAYMLVRTDNDEEYFPVIYNGMAYTKAHFEGEALRLSEPDSAGITTFDSESSFLSDLCVSSHALKLYNSNTPFISEKWVIMGVDSKSDLLSKYYDSRNTLVVTAILGLFIGLLMLYWINHIVTVPIRNLARELRSSDPNKPIKLGRAGVEEVDELAWSVESLSTQVAAAYSKISVITRMSESGIGVYEYDKNKNLVFCSHGLYEMLGWEEDVEQKSSTAYYDATDFRTRMEDMQKHVVEDDENLVKIEMKDGKPKWIKMNLSEENGVYLGVLKDVTSEVLEKHNIEYERDHDVLTALLNQRGFEDKLVPLFDEPNTLKKAALIVWDLDNLKYVNDTYGHTTGDIYIKKFAECLHRFDSDVICSARRSGDEFLTFLYGFNTEDEVSAQIRRIWDDIDNGYIQVSNERKYKLRVSAGIAWYPRNSDNYDKLFQFADFAMYTVKNSRKGTIQVFDHDLYQQDKILLQGQEAFNNLVENRLVSYMLQPIFSVSAGKIYGYEMLMRSEMEYFRSPLDILRMAHSQSRLYDIEVTTWFEAMKSFAALSKTGAIPNDCKVFINSISNQLMHPELNDVFKNIYSEYLSRIVCELTEEEQSNPQLTSRKVSVMKDWGAMTALDDYGCGYNSDAVLLEVSPDIVKIDISIVRGIDKDENRQSLVKNLLDYTKKRGIIVLGEGVETREEMETLVELGVELIQGYYLAKPSYEAAVISDRIIGEMNEAYKRYLDNHNLDGEA